MSRQMLADAIKHCSLNKVDVIKVTGSKTETMFQAHDDDKALFIVGNSNKPIEEFKGEFGINNMKLLTGLLEFSSFNTDEAEFKVLTRTVGDEEVIDRFEFKNGKNKTTFNLMNIQHVPQQAKIANIPWSVEFNIGSAKCGEIQKFSSLFSEIDKHVVFTTEDGALMMRVGKAGTSIHSGAILIKEDIGGDIQGELLFPADKVIMLLKLAVAAESNTIRFSNSGLIGVETATKHGVYNYYLRQVIRGS